MATAVKKKTPAKKTSKASAKPASKPDAKPAEQGKVNKSELIREYLKAHPEAGNKEVAERISAQIGSTITPQTVAVVKNLAKAKSGNGKRKSKATKASKSHQSNGKAATGIDAVINAASFIRQCGSVEQARAALQAAEQVANAMR